jgi:tRNA modification GTPase
VFSTTDTIVAIATPAGRGGLGIVRLSGPDAPSIACALLGRRTVLEPRRATFGRVREARDGIDNAARAIDQVVVTWFQAPHSYTTDDVVEISGHGSPVLMARIVEMAVEAGARLAGPGEFTLRAHLNGRMDLMQAEAVRDLVDAVTPLQARAAMDQLEGTLTGAIAEIEATLFDLAAKLEASLDFPEEGFHFLTREEARGELARARERLVSLLCQGRAGRMLREGSLVVIAGRPNAGKSSLFNALASADRAIVTEVPGTTRDVLTERVDIGGLPVTLVDTAGLREAGDAIEAEGVRRARQAQDVAALSLVVVDRSAGATVSDLAALAPSGAAVLVLSKVDRPAVMSPDAIAGWGGPVVEVSALTGEGLPALRRQIVSTLTGIDDLRDAPVISNVRHLAQVRDAIEALERSETAVAAGASEELVLAELAGARVALEELTGQRSSEDLLRHIFGRFCIGK